MAVETVHPLVGQHLRMKVPTQWNAGRMTCAGGIPPGLLGSCDGAGGIVSNCYGIDAARRARGRGGYNQPVFLNRVYSQMHEVPISASAIG